MMKKAEAASKKLNEEKKDENKGDDNKEDVEENAENKEQTKEDAAKNAEIDQTKESLDKLPGNEDLTAFQLAERNKRTVFVGNIPVDLVPKKLWKVFKGCGKIEKIWFRSIAPSSMITDRRNIGKLP